MRNSLRKGSYGKQCLSVRERVRVLDSQNEVSLAKGAIKTRKRARVARLCFPFCESILGVLYIDTTIYSAFGNIDFFNTFVEQGDALRNALKTL